MPLIHALSWREDAIYERLIPKAARRELEIQDLLIPCPRLIGDTHLALDRRGPWAQRCGVPRLAVGRYGFLRNACA